jgi:KDO2-lipid IV(A) lauroyltransferase
MGYAGYILTYFFIWLLHLLPEPLLYFVSELLRLLVYHVVRYRRKVVRENLIRAFPEFSLKKLRRTECLFYRHLCDLILESAVSYFYSEKRILQKITYKNTDLLDGYYRKGKQVIGVTGHYGNWEYLNTLALVCPYQVVGIYKPLKNKYFDRLVRRSRERFNTQTVPMEQVARKLIGSSREGTPTLTLFLSDQRPIFQHIQYWTNFLGQVTPLYLGAEKLARKVNAAVVFLKIRKVRRGRYEVEVAPVCEDPAPMEPYAITEAHVRILEELIREQPAYWLWSHRRWKHTYQRYLQEKEGHVTPGRA